MPRIPWTEHESNEEVVKQTEREDADNQNRKETAEISKEYNLERGLGKCYAQWRERNVTDDLLNDLM